MPCLLVLLAVAVPRLTMIFILILTDWFGKVFHGWGWPVLGFLFLPYTTLAYMAAYMTAGGVVGPWWLLVIIMAVLVDVGHWGGGWRVRRIRWE